MRHPAAGAVGGRTNRGDLVELAERRLDQAARHGEDLDWLFAQQPSRHVKVVHARAHHDRIDYLHVKSVDPEVMAAARRAGLPFPAAVARGAFCELDRGAVDFPAFGELLRAAAFRGFVVVEQDMYPAPPEKPLPIARANRDYLRGLGWG